jgi:hypothetical protein
MSFNFSVEQKFLDINQITIYRDRLDNLLKLKIINVEEKYPIKPIRYFPFTGDEHYVGLFFLEADGTIAKEIVLISDLKRLDENSRKLIEEELNKTYPLFKITKVLSVKQIGKTLRWQVITMEGEQTFEVLNQNDISSLSPSIVTIIDTRGNKYKINPLKLDEKSQSQLEIYL